MSVGSGKRPGRDNPSQPSAVKIAIILLVNLLVAGLMNFQIFIGMANQALFGRSNLDLFLALGLLHFFINLLLFAYTVVNKRLEAFLYLLGGMLP